MSQGWVIGAKPFKQTLLQEHRLAVAAWELGDQDLRDAQEAVRQDTLDALLKRVKQPRDALARAGKSASWKLAIATALKARTTATNRWLAETLHMGNMYEVSRKVSAWARSPDSALARMVGLTPIPKG